MRPSSPTRGLALPSDRAAHVRTGGSVGGAASRNEGGPGRDDPATVQTVCERLDGMPLAIELAAAWVRLLTPEQIAAGLDDRFRLLVDGPRGAIERHQTLAASMDWSHRLLDETDRLVFRRLAVFAGGFTLEAGRSVGADEPMSDQDVVAALSRLVDKSLVTVDEGARGPRYRLLDTIREYAQRQLDAANETAAARSRHLDHFRALVETAEPQLEHDQDTWRQVLEADHDNLRVAVEWGLATEPDHGRRMAAALSRWWFLHGHVQEGTTLLDRAIRAAPDDRSVLQADLLAAAALIALGNPELSRAARTRSRTSRQVASPRPTAWKPGRTPWARWTSTRTGRAATPVRVAAGIETSAGEM